MTPSSAGTAEITPPAPGTRRDSPVKAPPRPGRRAPRGAALLDLIFKIQSPRDAGRWTATLRSDPAIILIADDGDTLAARSRDLVLAVLLGHGPLALRAMRKAGTALPAPAAPRA